MADTTTTVQTIAANIDAGYKALQVAAGNLTGLLAVGKATCLDIQAYNSFARATYYAQVAMVQRARAAGDATGLPAVINEPTYFNYKGQINFACPTDTATSLQGALAAAMAPATPATQYLSLNEVQVTRGKVPVVRGEMPDYSQLTNQQGQLGLAPLVVIAIAGVAAWLGSKAVSALFDYFAEAKIQEQTTARNTQLLEGYAIQTKNRLDCYTQCVGRGGTATNCTETCARLVVTPPALATGAQRADDGSVLKTVGLIALAAVGGIAAFMFVRGGHHRPRSYAVAESASDE